MWFKRKNNTNQNPKSDMKFLVQWVAIATLLTFDNTKENTLTPENVSTIEAELVRLQAANKKATDDLATANTTIETMKGEKNTLQTSLDEANGKVTAHENTIGEHTATIATQKTTIESLKQVPGVAAAIAAAAKETGSTEGSADSLLNNIVKNEDDTAECMRLLQKEGYTARK